MNFTGNLILVAASLSIALAACQSPSGDCSEADCARSLDPVEAIGPGQESSEVGGLRRFQIEVIGEGQVLVNDEPCTTAQGICTLEVPLGTDIILKGDFGFQSESGGQVQEGRCTSSRGCRLTVGLDQTVIADVDVDGGDSAQLEGRPFGFLPGQPGIIVDDFQSQNSPVAQSLSQGGQISN